MKLHIDIDGTYPFEQVPGQLSPNFIQVLELVEEQVLKTLCEAGKVQIHPPPQDGDWSDITFEDVDRAFLNKGYVRLTHGAIYKHDFNYWYLSENTVVVDPVTPPAFGMRS